MSTASFDIQKFVNGLEKEAQPRVIEAGKVAIVSFAHHVIRESNVLCPVEKGNLVGSWFVGPVQEAGGLMYVEIGYNTNYAAAVHERVFSSAGKPIYHKPPTSAKFLEISMRANDARMAPFVIDAMKQELKL